MDCGAETLPRNEERSAASSYLPEAFAYDPDRLARFQREAQVLASLNHPGIAAIYGLEDSGHTKALVLELVEGPTLADRIKRGPIPLDEALPIAKQIAEALEAAHEAGVIHRDLKPANIKVRDDGTVKVLDFGLAKAFQPDANDPNLSQSPTISLTAAATQMGMVIGTAAYMAPEQASGKVVDKRADVWAFGVVLYEMLTGTRPFVGDDVSQTLAHVIAIAPDWSTLPDTLPPVLRNFLRGCLEKNPKQRVGDIRDVRLAMEGVFEPNAVAQPVASDLGPAAWQRPAVVAVVVLLVAIVGGFTTWSLGPDAVETQGVGRFSIALSEEQQLTRPGRNLVAVSPDGAQIVYVANGQLYLRNLHELSARPIPGTAQDPMSPFFSPDGESIGFVSAVDRQLKRVSTVGGTPIPLCEVVDAPFGASWGPDDTIVFGQGRGVMRVSAKGGVPELVVEADEGEQIYGPEFFPDGRSLLFTATSAAGETRWDQAEITVQSLDSGERRVVLTGGSDARYVATGHLLFAFENTLFATAFDLSTLQTYGRPVPVVEDVRRATSPGLSTASANYGISRNGMLVYLPAPITSHGLAWVDRAGQVVTPLLSGQFVTTPRLSPQGTQVAFRDVGTGDVWIWNTERDSRTRLTETATFNSHPVWSPDGATVAFASIRGGRLQIYSRPVDLSQETEPLLPTDTRGIPGAWTPDGRTLVYQDYSSDRDIWMRSAGADPAPFLATSFNEYAPRLSHDGKWLAYISDQAGEEQVYVQAFPEGGPVIPISTGRGREAVWSRDSSELFYRSGNQMWVVDVETGPAFAAATPRLLFEAAYAREVAGLGVPNYDVSLDGQKFLMVQPADATLVVVQNWFEELKRLVPVD